MKFIVTAQVLVPMFTEVETETVEDAVGEARKRLLGKDSKREWVMDEDAFTAASIQPETVN